ncbi:hypothetical protein PR202_ga09207 [Eleusine coracana subsp. coracana]|uniref:Epidermal patterning factor-like protein n=1 Tax=Eleusine coracana subsp. coracana TaxID=191504 RepID=A0AAV5C1Y6_ELECO|nr:hypothetical protein QOZ80_1AG0038240 [Eleusine coracana subsp. coracana]GJM92714.1 hypothetical protein PR202_ga09207 [Eleusine coracana subsp. coracana]
MECSRSRGRRSMLKLAALCFALAVSLCCVCVWYTGCGVEEGAAVLRSDFRRTPAPCTNQGGCAGAGGGGVRHQWQQRRRLLSTRASEGPGSYPPRCASKCGECNPCYPVHVAVPPGVPVTTEYYPEAWRCKCGKRLYMP